MKRVALITLVSLLFTLTSIAAAQDPFAAQVRTTDPLTPEEEQKSFKLPPGFEMQLVAAEPQILKPMNMAFDERGRLWITESTEYPYAAALDQKGRDNIKILEDTDGDGRADKVTTFADGLNIPIGLYPYSTGGDPTRTVCIAFSIPNIWKLEDTDGDDVADKRTKLFGPMGYERDTHGLNNAFRRGFDGWLYACHGFNNETTVKGADGHSITMHSGNTYRMRLNGSRVEQFTHGQVNPFGMAMDPLGNLFTADCHSKPIYQLLRGGYYPSFGKPHDGLGFVPPMMDHTHGSTAICGIAYYEAENFPRDYRGNLFTGNVMTSRVNRNSLFYHGSTIQAKEEADFVVTTDPWFRPVDIQLGPDGALYVADFYNRIIGHYEVALDHPGRDRHRGRIWRIVYNGDAPESKPAHMPPSLADASALEVAEALSDPNLTRRMLAMNLLADRHGRLGVAAADKTFGESQHAAVRSHALWVLHRLGASTEALPRAAADPDRLVRVHAMKVLAEISDWSDGHREMALKGLEDDDAFVRQAAADALGQHPQADNIQPLLTALEAVADEDVILRHTIRIALKNQLTSEGSFKAIQLSKLDADDARVIASVALAAQPADAASFLIDYVTKYDEQDRNQLAAYLQHAARFAAPEQTDTIANVVRERLKDDLEFQTELFASVFAGLEQRGAAPSEKIKTWGAELASRLIEPVADDSAAWTNSPVVGKPRQDNPWVLQQRPSADGNRDAWFLCSLPSGEQATGILRSPQFEIPAKLSFFTAGHIGPPDQPVNAMNFIRLREAATGELLAESAPPRNDTAQRVQWNFDAHAGKQGYVEIVDGDDRGAYAWLAVGRFDPPVVSLPKHDPRLVGQRQQAAAQLAAKLKLNELTPRLRELLVADATDAATSKAIADALIALEPDSHLAALPPILADPSVSESLRKNVKQAIVDREPDATLALLGESLRTSPQRLQRTIAESLAADRSGAETLLELIAKGQASPRLLLDNTLQLRLRAAKLDNIDERLKQLTAGLPSQNEEIQKLIEARRNSFATASTSLENGTQVFTKHCASCHQLDGKGAMVGPQLDGIGNRGAERLIEDILDPHRNVDIAFRTSTIITTDGKVLTGLFRRAEGETLVFADNKGQEFTVAKNNVDEENKTHLSLMPENLADTISQQEFSDLIGFLLTKRAAAEDAVESSTSGR